MPASTQRASGSCSVCFGAASRLAAAAGCCATCWVQAVCARHGDPAANAIKNRHACVRARAAAPAQQRFAAQTCCTRPARPLRCVCFGLHCRPGSQADRQQGWQWGMGVAAPATCCAGCRSPHAVWDNPQAHLASFGWPCRVGVLCCLAEEGERRLPAWHARGEVASAVAGHAGKEVGVWGLPCKPQAVHAQKQGAAAAGTLYQPLYHPL